MSFAYQIRPLSVEIGFELSCEGVLSCAVSHPRLIDAIVHAAQLGRAMSGEIQIFDSAGQMIETLPLPNGAAGGVRRAIAA